MTEDELWSAVVRWMATITGLPTIRAEQEGIPPDPPYCAVNLVEQGPRYKNSVNTVYEIVDDELTGSRYKVRDWRWEFSLHCYGSGCTDYLGNVIETMEHTQGLEPLYPTVIPSNYSAVRSWSETLHQRKQLRAQMDLTIVGTKRLPFIGDIITSTESPDISAE